MRSRIINKWSIVTLAVLAALLIGGGASDVGAFSVDVNHLYYYDPSGPREIDYDFSAGTLGDGTTIPINNIGIPGTNPPILQKNAADVAFIFGNLPMMGATTVTLNTSAHVGTITTTQGGAVLQGSSSGAPPTPATSWTYALKLQNFSGLTDPAISYRFEIGMASPMNAGPQPRFRGAWNSSGSLNLMTAIYDEAGEGTTLWSGTPVVLTGLTPSATAIVLKIENNGTTVTFSYRLNDNTGWTNMPGVYTIANGLVFNSLPMRFPYIFLKELTAESPFQVSSHHWNDAQGNVYRAWPRVNDPGQALYSGITMNSPGYLTETPLAYNSAAGYWSLSGTLFSDDFNNNAIDTAKWSTLGNSVTESGGQFNVDQAVTDKGGEALSKAIIINPYATITVQRKAKVRYANQYFDGLFGLYFKDTPDFAPAFTDSYGNQHFNMNDNAMSVIVSHANYEYTGGGEQAVHGFYLGRYAAHSSNPTSLASTFLSDTWFDEKVVYNPVTGIAELYLDGVLKATYNVGVLPVTARYLKIFVQAWGWNTGHYNYSDDLTVSQPWTGGDVFLSSNTPPAGDVAFNFTATKQGGGTETVTKNISGYVTEFASNLLPAGNVSGTPIFSWTGIGGATSYAVQVYDANYNRIWDRYNIPSSTTTVPYNDDGKGPALVSGQTYQYDIVTSVVTGGVNNDSFAHGSFTYTGVGNATTISFSGSVVTLPNWPSTDGMLPAVGAQVSAYSPSAQQTPICTATADAATGAFTLTGIPKSSDFYLVVQPSQPGYLPALSKIMNWNDNITGLLSFALFTPTQLGNTPGNGIIIGRVALKSSPSTYLPGAVVVAREWIPPVPPAMQPTLGATYPVTYTSGGTATGTDGVYMVKNIPAGGLVQLVATLGGHTFDFNGAIVPARPMPVSEESFFATPISGGATISFSGDLAKYSDSTPIGGATVELVGNAAIKTTTATNGSFTLSGLLPGTEFSVKFTGDAAYVPSYTTVMQSTNPIVSSRGFNLFTPAELSGWGVAGGRGLIRGRVINGVNQQEGYISGAVVNYTSSKGKPYVVKYEDVQGNLVDGATTANGKYYILNVEEGDIITVSASQANYTFSQSKKFIARDGAVCQGIITGNPIAGRVAIGGFVMNQANPAVGIGSATIEQIGSAPVNSAVSNADGSYYLTVPAGTNVFLKFSKPQAGTPLAPTYTPEMKFAGSFTNIGEFNLFTTTKLTEWGVTSGKGIIRARVKDSAGNFLGGAVVTAQSLQGRTYTVCYDDACSGLSSTDGSSGRFVIKNVEPGDTVTVTAAKDGYAFNTRVFHIYADSVHQGGINGATADEGQIRSRFNALLAEFNKGASANIETIRSFFADNYLNDGENRDALMANMLKDLQEVPFQQRTTISIMVTIDGGGATAQMVVNWWNGEIETFTLTKIAGVWMVTGNQKKYRVEAWSATYQSPTGGIDYWADMKVNDPQHVISSVSVAGPKTGNTVETFSLVWNADEKAWTSWAYGQDSVGPQFGITKPTLPLNYTFTITETGKSPETMSVSVNNFVEVFATPVRPAAGSTVTGVPTFNWIGVGGNYTYGIEVGSSSGGNQWGRFNLVGTTYVYDGPALAAGSSYYHIQVRDAAGNFSMVGVPFTYSGEILKGDIDGNGAVNLVDAILAVKVIGGQTPDGIRENYSASGTDVNGDGQVGLHEGLYILQKIAGLRDALNVWHPRTPSVSDASGSSTFFEAIAGPNGFLIGGQGTIQKSSDGITWYNSNLGSNSDNFLGLTGNVDGSLFAAGRFGLILKSTDVATTWASSKAASSSGFMSIAAGNGKIVAVGYDSGDNRRAIIFTSADGGGTWSETTPGTSVIANVTSYEGVTFGNGKFVVAGYAFNGSAYTAVILTSTDGSTWTAANVTASAGLQGVTWGGGKFIAVGNYGAVLTSPDGANWAVQNSGITDKHFNAAGYGGGFYVIAGTDGTLLTSPDGAVWTSRSSGTTKHLWGVAFGKNTFLVVGGESNTSTGPIILQSDPL